IAITASPTAMISAFVFACGDFRLTACPKRPDHRVQRYLAPEPRANRHSWRGIAMPSPPMAMSSDFAVTYGGVPPTTLRGERTARGQEDASRCPAAAPGCGRDTTEA